MPLMAAAQFLNEQDRFEGTEVDMQMFASHGTQLNSQFLIDADGVIRWSFIEAQRGPEDICSMPGEDEMIAAAKAARL